MTTKPAYVDLHMHTEYSDGTCTPRELVKLAKWNGLDIIAVTDHDNFAGYEEAKRFGEMYGLWVVPGVEFTTPDYHLLGLNFNPRNSRIREFIEYSRERQKLRTGDRIKVLQEYGVPITIEKVEKVFPKARIGRLNIMEAMLIECSPWLKIKHGWNTPTEELFAYYFKKLFCPAILT